MNATQCHRENELLDALGHGFVGAELAAHVAGCAPCSELKMVAGALLDERVDAIAEAPVPSAGTMWWRMQLRRRQEAQAAARRSLVAGQAMTLTIALALAVSLFGADVAAELRGAFHMLAAVRFSTPLLIAAAVLGAWALGAPIVAWVAVRQKS